MISPEKQRGRRLQVNGPVKHTAPDAKVRDQEELINMNVRGISAVTSRFGKPCRPSTSNLGGGNIDSLDNPWHRSWALRWSTVLVRNFKSHRSCSTHWKLARLWVPYLFMQMSLQKYGMHNASVHLLTNRWIRPCLSFQLEHSCICMQWILPTPYQPRPAWWFVFTTKINLDAMRESYM